MKDTEIKQSPARERIWSLPAGGDETIQKEAVEALLQGGLITAEEAALAAGIPMADDITVEADSGGHTDGRPLVSMLPALIALANRKQKEFGYGQRVRVGAGGGIGTGLSCLGAFEMGAAYVVTGSVNQGCVESGTSDYVKQIIDDLKCKTDVSRVGAKCAYRVFVRHTCGKKSKANRS